MIELECVGGPWAGQKRSLFPGTTRLFVAAAAASVRLESELDLVEQPAQLAYYELVIPRAPNQKNAFLAWMGE